MYHGSPIGRLFFDSNDSSLIICVYATVLPLANSAVLASKTADGLRITNVTGQLTDTQLTGRGMGQGIS